MTSEVLAVVLMVAVVIGLAASTVIVLAAPLQGGSQVVQQEGGVQGRWDTFNRCALEEYQHTVSDKLGWHEETGKRLRYPELCQNAATGSPAPPVRPQTRNVTAYVTPLVAHP